MQSRLCQSLIVRSVIILAIPIFLLSCGPSDSSAPETDGDYLRSVSFGESEEDMGRAVCVDSSGNVYATGYFRGVVDFDPGPGIVNLDAGGTTNGIFIVKLDSAGSLVWAKAVSDTYSCIGYGIALDSSGDVLVTGFFWDIVDFDPGTGTYNLTAAGQSDVFVLKLDNDGDFIWARGMGGIQYDNGFGIALDGSGNVLVAGYFEGLADFDPGAGTANLTSNGDLDIFIAKLDSSGDYVWARGIGGTSEDRGYGVDVDSSGAVYATGFFQGTVDFDPGAGTYELANAAGNDIFVNKLDSGGNFAWAAGIPSGEGRGIVVDPSGGILTTGYFTGTSDFDPGAGTANLSSDSGSQDIFVSELDASGNYVWAGSMGGSLNDNGTSIAVDSSGNVFTTGFFQASGDFDPGSGVSTLPHDTNNDIFVSKLNGSRNFVWAKAMSGSSDEVGYGICASSSGDVYATGSFIGTVDFDPGPGVFNMVSASGTPDEDDIFIVSLDGP